MKIALKSVSKESDIKNKQKVSDLTISNQNSHAFHNSSNQKDLSFGCEGTFPYSKIIKQFSSEFGKAAGDELKETIERLLSKKHPLMTLQGDKLTLNKRHIPSKFNSRVLNPILNAPIDMINSSLDKLKKIPALKNSQIIDNILGTKVLANRRTYLDDYSNAMAIRHYTEMFDKKTFAERVNEGRARLKPRIANYQTRSERTSTRIISGMIPAFFLANDAYNLSMFVNNDKKLAKDEKKRRFNQEVGRIGITAAVTFVVLSMLGKKSNTNPGIARFAIAATTFASEIIGRIMVGTPFYPVTENQSKKYAKLKKKDENKEENKETKSNENKLNTANKQMINKKDNALKFLVGIVLFGFAAEKLPKYVRPIKNTIYQLSSRYKDLLQKDFTISQKEFKEIISQLRKNGFDKLADNYDARFKKIIADGNLTIKESRKLDRKIDELAESKIPDIFITNTEKYEKAKKSAKASIDRNAVMKELGISPRNTDIINLSAMENKFMSIPVDQILGLPVRFAWEVLTMPYRYVVKPLIELPKSGFKIIQTKIKTGDFPEFKPKEEKLLKNEDLKNNIQFLQKIKDDPNYKSKLAKTLVDSFDDETKSSFSNAELAGDAKVAVSTVTSAFLIFDNYNLVMIDSEGKDKKLAAQKAKERTVQRIIRIAYGAGLIKLFNNVFKPIYDTSLIIAGMVTASNVVLTEMLERISVGLPLHEATREEIIEKDNENLNAKGLKGSYFKLMSELTGKKPISKKANK